MTTNWKEFFSGKKSDRETAEDFSAFSTEVQGDVSIVTITRPVSADTFIAFIKAFADRGLLPRRVWDFSQIEFPFSVEDVRRIAELGKNLDPNEHRYAVIVKDDVGFGTTRLFSVYREQENVQSMIFRSRDEALAWIQTDNDS